MFTDTHFHMNHLEDLGISLNQLFSQLADQDFAFLQDIGTRCDDLKSRLAIREQTLAAMEDRDKAKKIDEILYFSAGIWPDAQAIIERDEQMAELENQISSCPRKDKLIAIGECGLDHHWNVNGADHRSQDDFDEKILKGESELFEMQLELGKKLELPVIIHSRDAFEGTLSCIKNIGYNNGEIHCFSYGKKEAEAFLDLGWYIALGGAVTYTKKTKMEEMKDLIRYIPRDRLLLETDSPYLAPVPFRGKTNTPLLILNTYQFIAEILCMDKNTLGLISFENAKKLFLA
ncbi:MAG: TatD family hydrolase [Treponemataceae bacterium]|nr:TatD family hydrolase [Treponemataceae bacterium]